MENGSMKTEGANDHASSCEVTMKEIPRVEDEVKNKKTRGVRTVYKRPSGILTSDDLGGNPIEMIQSEATTEAEFRDEVKEAAIMMAADALHRNTSIYYTEGNTVLSVWETSLNGTRYHSTSHCLIQVFAFLVR